jgi:3',5'-cyclic AMP phosphodiesterase CpdA
VARDFVHLSDLHLTSLAGVSARELFSKRFLGYLSWRRRRRLEHRRERLDALVADFAGGGAPEIVITGDLTHIGLEREFRAAADWLAALAPPVMRHRIITNFNADSDGIKTDTIIRRLLDETPKRGAD